MSHLEQVVQERDALQEMLQRAFDAMGSAQAVLDAYDVNGWSPMAEALRGVMADMDDILRPNPADQEPQHV